MSKPIFTVIQWVTHHRGWNDNPKFIEQLDAFSTKKQAKEFMRQELIDRIKAYARFYHGNQEGIEERKVYDSYDLLTLEEAIEQSSDFHRRDVEWSEYSWEIKKGTFHESRKESIEP